MSFSCITTKKEWQEAINSLPDFYGKIYYDFAYLQALKANKEGNPAAHVYLGKKGMAFYPFLLRKIPSELSKGLCTMELYDLESPYGYGGPYFYNLSSEEEEDFFKEHSKWAKNKEIVAEFLRCSPFTAVSQRCQSFYDLVHNRTTVQIPLNKDFNKILMECTNPRKRNYKRAEKHLYVETMQLTQENIGSFQAIYKGHMKRLNASNYYFFSKEYFTALFKLPPENIQLIFVKDKTDQQLVGAGIFLLDQYSSHYHLGATDPVYSHLQPSTMLLLSGAKNAAKAQKRFLHLGGGLKDDPKDPLFVFKKGFSSHHLSFKIGKKIHNPILYQQLSQRWQKLSGIQSSQLLHYHNLGDEI